MNRQKTDRLVDPKVHDGEMRIGSDPMVWELRDGNECCSYCGSLSPEAAMLALQTPGTKFSGTDKTGYKAYIEPAGVFGKFYFRHLRALDQESFSKFSSVIRSIFGWSFERDETGKQHCYSPQSRGFFGFQTWGIIGEDGKPVFGEGSPNPPTEEWWENSMKK